MKSELYHIVDVPGCKEVWNGYLVTEGACESKLVAMKNRHLKKWLPLTRSDTMRGKTVKKKKKKKKKKTVWNTVSIYIESSSSLNKFKNVLKKHYIGLY